MIVFKTKKIKPEINSEYELNFSGKVRYLGIINTPSGYMWWFTQLEGRQNVEIRLPYNALGLDIIPGA